MRTPTLLTLTLLVLAGCEAPEHAERPRVAYEVVDGGDRVVCHDADADSFISASPTGDCIWDCAMVIGSDDPLRVVVHFSKDNQGDDAGQFVARLMFFEPCR